MKCNSKISFLICCLYLFSFSLIASVKSVSESSVSNTMTYPHGKQVWNFDVYLDETFIGHHRFLVEENKTETRVSISAEFDIKFLFISVYNYKHNNSEVWKNNCLVKMQSYTDDNGDFLTVKLNRQAGGSLIETVDTVIKEMSCVRSFAYWNKDLIKSGSLLNSQNGEIVNVDFIFMGEELYELNNKKLTSKRYQLRGKDSQGKTIEIDLWYTESNHWLALKSKLDNGSYLRYQLSTEVTE